MSAESVLHPAQVLATLLPWQTPVWQQLLRQMHKGQLAHAYLVAGEQGIGKLQFIQYLTRYLLCQSPLQNAPCGNCVNCLLGIENYHPDMLLIQPEEGSRDIKVDQIRALSEFAAQTSHSGLAKVVIVNQAHNLNTSAANSLLKTLEEPGKSTFIFLITAKADSLPATLRSRCQRLLMQTPTLAETTQWLREQGIDADQVATLALAAGNRPFYARTLAEINGIAHAKEFMQSLLAVTQRRIPVQSAVAVAVKIGNMFAIEYLSRISSIVIRELFSDTLEQDDLLAEMVQAFAATKGRPDLIRRLLQFNVAADKGLRQLQSATNPNPQLMLESLLWQWAHLGSAAPAANNPRRGSQN